MPVLYLIVIILGFCTSYTDIKYKKIKNAYLFWALVVAVLTYAYMIISKDANIKTGFIINCIIGFAIGFLLYLLNLWSAGDAKLFFVYCLLIPTSRYSNIFLFPSLAVFANIFVVSTIILSILAFKNILVDKKAFLNKLLCKGTFFKLGVAFLTIFSFAWLVSFVSRPLIGHFNPFLGILILYLVYMLIYYAIRKSRKSYLFFLILIGATIIRFLILPEDFYFKSLVSYFQKTALYTAVFYLINLIFDLNEDKKETIPFAPLMFIGVLLTNTDFVFYIINFLNILKR